MTRYQAEVVIIGGGVAGLAATIELLHAGNRVLLIDRDDEDLLGGLARESFGVLFVVGTPEQKRARILDTEELAFRDWCRFGELTEADGNAYLWAQRYVERCRPDIYEWVKTLGIKFVPSLLWAERGLNGEGNAVPRHHLVWGTGFELARVLAQTARHHQASNRLTCKFRHRVDGLSLKGGLVRGCHGIDEATGTAFEVEAEAVIVATGGVNGNDEIIRENWHRDWGSTSPEVVLNGSHKYATGILHKAVREAGGALSNLDRNWNYAAGIPHPRPRKPRHGLSTVPCKSALWLDASGRRFGPAPLVPGYDTRDLVSTICQVAEQKSLPKHSWQVMNRKIMLKEFAISGSEYNANLRDKKLLSTIRTALFGDVSAMDRIIAENEAIVVAHSLAALIEKMQSISPGLTIDGAGMIADITAYDDAIERGPRFYNDHQLIKLGHLRSYGQERGRLCKFQKIADPVAGPLIAIKLNIISRKSLGGIQTDLTCNVVGTDGTSMPTLYAAGEAAGFGGGGIHGLRSLESTFLGACILTGRTAGRAAAASL